MHKMYIIRVYYNNNNGRVIIIARQTVISTGVCIYDTIITIIVVSAREIRSSAFQKYRVHDETMR